MKAAKSASLYSSPSPELGELATNSHPESEPSGILKTAHLSPRVPNAARAVVASAANSNPPDTIAFTSLDFIFIINVLDIAFYSQLINSNPL